MQAINWSDLQIFLAVAQTGHLGRAGAALRIDATTVSRRLRRLEAGIGANLFEQTRQGQMLTESGEALLLRVERMAEAAAELNSSREGRTAPLSGTLRISVAEGFGSWFLARHLPPFAQSHPKLVIDLVANSGFLSLSKREADIAVMLSRPKAGPIIASKLSDYLLGMYASPTYLKASGVPSQPTDLIYDHDLVGYVPDLIYAPELRYLDEIHPGLNAKIRSSSINAQRQLLAAGAGIGVLPCFMGDADDDLVQVLPAKRIRRSFWMLMHKDTHQLARIKAGKSWLVATVRQHRTLLCPTNTENLASSAV